MALGSIFGRFWIQVGRQVEAKLEPKSSKMALQKDVQKMITNLLCGPTQAAAGREVEGPLKEFKIQRTQRKKGQGPGPGEREEGQWSRRAPGTLSR